MEGTPEVFVLCMVPLWLRTTHLGNLSILRILTGRLPASLGQTYHSISPVMHIDNNEYFHVERPQQSSIPCSPTWTDRSGQDSIKSTHAGFKCSACLHACLPVINDTMAVGPTRSTTLLRLARRPSSIPSRRRAIPGRQLSSLTS